MNGVQKESSEKWEKGRLPTQWEPWDGNLGQYTGAKDSYSRQSQRGSLKASFYDKYADSKIKNTGVAGSGCGEERTGGRVQFKSFFPREFHTI